MRIAFGILVFVLGCGPMTVPMVERLDLDEQQQVDESWNRALTPVKKLTRQQWLDLFVLANVYQVGVDKLELRSEKTFKRGRVVMEIHFDRRYPNRDVFKVQVIDLDDRIIRTESYSREDVESTVKDFSGGVPDDPESGEVSEEAKEIEARVEFVKSYFPKDEEEQTHD